MRFSLQDIKKSVQRRGGELVVSLHFLRRDELHTEIARLITYYETLLGQSQRRFSIDEARAYIGDYRFAHCLIATLSHWYMWHQPSWTEVLERAGAHTLPADISSPVQLRLALYSYVNEHYRGFLAEHNRVVALRTFAERYRLRVADLEYLLTLDSDDEALLVRETAQPPSPQEVATLYNQWAFEAALFNASSVRFVIDVQAFGRATNAQDTNVGTGVGAVVKRLCFLARKIGVYYELAYEATLPGTEPLLMLTISGPQEVTGTAQQYGLRLARLCRLLLGYTSRPELRQTKKGQKATLSNGIVRANATIHFLQRGYTFALDAQVLRAIEMPGDVQQERLSSEQVEHSTLFDSGVEQSFAEAFSALTSSQGADGWRLEREPEPLLLASSIFISDFALTRARRRIYVEILGFWTPSYRERKIQKLQQLQGRNDLLLAIPGEAKEAFAPIAALFPIVYYDGQLSATEVLHVLRHHYDDFAERLMLIDSAAVQAQVAARYVLSERACYEVLHCYRRSELQQAVEQVLTSQLAFLAGLGLYDIAWMATVRSSFSQWLAMMPSSLSLQVALSELKTRWPVLQQCEDVGLESLLGTWSGVQIRRDSIFDATIQLVESSHYEPSTELVVRVTPEKPEKRVVRERRVGTKKRTKSETTQGDLWG